MEGYKGALTILSRDVVSAEGLGFRMATEPRAGGDADGQAEAKPLLSDSECLLSPDRQGIQVAGVPLNNPSSIASLRAGCKYLGISQVGPNSNCFIVWHNMRTSCVCKFFKSWRLNMRNPWGNQCQNNNLCMQFSPEERALHEVNQLPYASWCESCVMAKRRPNTTRTPHIRS